MNNNMTLGNATIAWPSSLSIEPMEISRRGQTASGKTTKEVIAVKNKFSLRWNWLTGTDYQAIKAALATGDFITFVYPDNGSTGSATVYTDGGVRAEFVNRVGDWLYRNAELILIEQ